MDVLASLMILMIGLLKVGQTVETTGPVVLKSMEGQDIVIAINIGTRYSKAALATSADFQNNSQKISASLGKGKFASLGEPTCALFYPNKEFHSFGSKAEETYLDLAIDGKHVDWFFFRRFTTFLNETKKLTRNSEIKDVSGHRMSAMFVISESIRFINRHLLSSITNVYVDYSVHLVLAVPATYDDASKQFMREAAIQSGIPPDFLSFALELEVTSLFYAQILSPSTRYIVLGTTDITLDISVLEVQSDHTVHELYKALSGPWRIKKIGDHLLDLITEIVGRNTMEIFKSNNPADYIGLLYEIEEKELYVKLDVDLVVKLPVSLLETYKNTNGQDIRQTIQNNKRLEDKVILVEDKLHIKAEMKEQLILLTSDATQSRLNESLSETVVKETNTILLIGEYFNLDTLTRALLKTVPNKTIVTLPDSEMDVLRGAVLFGHTYNTFKSHVSRFTYGLAKNCTIENAVNKTVKNDTEKNNTNRFDNCFQKHIERGKEVISEFEFEENLRNCIYNYIRQQKQIFISLYKCDKENPTYIDEPGCTDIGRLTIDVNDINGHDEQDIIVKIRYGGAELEARATMTGLDLHTTIDFLNKT